MQDKILQISISLILIFAISCSESGGAGGFVVGKIEGPDSIAEYYGGTYRIEASGDSEISYNWRITPENLGNFFNPNQPITSFEPDSVEEATTAYISVDISSPGGLSLTKSRKITVENIEGLDYGKIEGPTPLNSDSSAVYSIEANGSTGFNFVWTCFPADAGAISEPNRDRTSFTPSEFSRGSDIFLAVAINSSDYPEFHRTLIISVPGDSQPGNPPTAMAEVDKTTATAYKGVPFHDVSTDPDGEQDIVKLEWDFDFREVLGFRAYEPLNPLERHPIHHYSTMGVKRIQLKAIDSLMSHYPYPSKTKAGE